MDRGKSFSSSYGNATPIFDAAFGDANASDYTNQQFVTYLKTGQAGVMAATLAGVNGTVPYSEDARPEFDCTVQLDPHGYIGYLAHVQKDLYDDNARAGTANTRY